MRQKKLFDQRTENLLWMHCTCLLHFACMQVKSMMFLCCMGCSGIPWLRTGLLCRVKFRNPYEAGKDSGSLYIVRLAGNPGVICVCLKLVWRLEQADCSDTYQILRNLRILLLPRITRKIHAAWRSPCNLCKEMGQRRRNCRLEPSLSGLALTTLRYYSHLDRPPKQFIWNRLRWDTCYSKSNIWKWFWIYTEKAVLGSFLLADITRHQMEKSTSRFMPLVWKYSRHLVIIITHL